MTDEQWLNAIKKYDSEHRTFHIENPEKGGAPEFAAILQQCVEEDPERFVHLSLRFPSNTNPVYMAHTLKGLQKTEASSALKLKVCRKAYKIYSGSNDECAKAIAGLLGSIKDPLPNDALKILTWLATEHPDPKKEMWDEEVTDGTPDYGEDILNYGINTTRGRATLVISDLISSDALYIDHFRVTVEHLVNDSSLAVRSCAGSVLLEIINHDTKFALEQFLKLTEPRDSLYDYLLVTPFVDRFIAYAIRDHFGQLRHVVERILRSKVPETSEAGARLASLAVLYQHSDAGDLVEEALRGNASQRLGVAQVASANIMYKDCRSWAEQKLLLFFDDPDSKVRGEAVECFRRLQKQPLESYANLIEKFYDSMAYQQGAVYLFSILHESSHRLPDITYEICKKFFNWLKAGDIRMRRSLDFTAVIKLVFRTYHQHQSDDLASKCLDLIDQMCLEWIYGVEQGLDEYER